MDEIQNAALLVVDVQQGLLDKGPFEKERLVETIAALLGDFRRAFVFRRSP